MMRQPEVRESIPTYALYGESDQPFLPERLHCESIARRSRLYGWTIGTHRHDLFVQILFVRAGSGTAWLGDAEVALHPPCALWIPAKLSHGFHFSSDIDGDVITVVAQHADALLVQDAELLARLARPHCLPLSTVDVDQARGLGGVLAALLAEVNAREIGRLTAIETALRLVLLRLARAAEAGCVSQPITPTRAAGHMRRFIALIDHHFREQQPLGFYAERLGLSPTQLNRVCRQQAGMSALQMVQRRVLHEAERDLVYSAISVKEIALSLGFADAGYFSRFFTRHLSQAPSEFRRMAWQRLRENDVAAVDT